MAFLETTQQHMLVDDQTIREAQRVADALPAGPGVLFIHDAQGSAKALPERIERILRSALEALAEHGSAHISQTPETLTSTTAADLLGISRPTLMKLTRDGDIASHKVGTHTRFRTDDVLALRKQREKDRNQAFTDLLALEDEE